MFSNRIKDKTQDTQSEVHINNGYFFRINMSQILASLSEMQIQSSSL